MNKEITEKDRMLAKICLHCVLCGHARKRQKGPVFWFVKKIGRRLCPFCIAYERVYGKKSHE